MISSWTFSLEWSITPDIPTRICRFPVYLSSDYIMDVHIGYVRFLSHVIENTANQKARNGLDKSRQTRIRRKLTTFFNLQDMSTKARNPLHILRYTTGSIPRKNPGVPCGLQILPAERSIKEPATGQNFHSEKKGKTCTFKKRCQSVEYFFH